MAYKLDMFNRVLPAIDNKDYTFYDNMSEEERKAFSAFMGLKWGASISGDRTLQHYYLASMNHHANKHMFDLAKHPKLQWMMLVAGSPNFGKQRHEWISAKTKPVPKAIKDIRAELKTLYPMYKDDEIELLSTMVTKKELKQHKKDSGN